MFSVLGCPALLILRIALSKRCYPSHTVTLRSGFSITQSASVNLVLADLGKRSEPYAPGGTMGYRSFFFFTLSHGVNMGTLFLYPLYSLPKRFSSSCSSTAFNSSTLSTIKIGVNMKTKDTELNKIPSPNSRMNTPVSIGFLT